MADVFELNHVSWHPDGRRISLLVRRRDLDFSELDTVAPTGGPVDAWSFKNLPEIPVREIFSAEWHPSGAAIYIQAGVPSKIWRVAKTPGTPGSITAERLVPGMPEQLLSAVSPDGKQVAFEVPQDSLRLWSFPIDASGKVEEDHGQPISPQGARAAVGDLGRDGRTLVYVLADRDNPDLLVQDLETRAVRTVGAADREKTLAPAAIRRGPHLSWDSRKLAYFYDRFDERQPQSAEAALAVYDLDSNHEYFLTTPRHDYTNPHRRFALPTDWTPDGQAVLAASDLLTPHFSLGLWPLSGAPHAETAVKTLVADDNYNLWQGRFSPDGRWIAFVAQKFGDNAVTSVGIMPSNGGDSKHWHLFPDQYGSTDKPRWSPDGRVLYYTRLSDGFLNIWKQPFDTERGTTTGAPVQVTHFETPARRIFLGLGWLEPCVSSSRLILLINETAGNLWMVDNADR